LIEVFQKFFSFPIVSTGKKNFTKIKLKPPKKSVPHPRGVHEDKELHKNQTERNGRKNFTKRELN